MNGMQWRKKSVYLASLGYAGISSQLQKKSQNLEKFQII